MNFLYRTFIACVFLLTCTYTSFAESPASKTVRIAAFNHYPAIFKAQDNSIQGYYVDFISEIAKREGWNIEYIYGDWADGLARIKSGEVDVLTSVTLTQERTAFMDYGKAPLNTVWSELYVNKQSSIDNIRQVQGKRIAIMKGDTNGANLRNLVDKFGIPCQFVEYGNFDDIFTAISSLQVDGGVVNNTYGAAKQRDFNVKSSGVIFNPFDIYFTVAKGKNHTVLETLDRYLAEWRANENSPYHLARQRWSHADSRDLHVIPRWLTDALIGLAIVSIVAVAFIILLRKQVSIKTSRLTAQAGERKKIEETLFFINKCGSQYHGEDLIAALTTHLAESLGVEYTFVSQLLPNKQRVRTRGLYAMGTRVDEIEYNLLGTPCENVVGKNVCYYPDKVSSLFPQGKLLVDMGAVGYAACPLWDSHGIGIGLLCVISTQPLQNQSLVETIIQIVGTRAAQEIEAMSHLEELIMKNFTIENMTDAVFWIYSDGRVWNATESACRSLGYTKEELLSKSVLDFAPEFSYDTWPTNWQELRDTGNLRFESSHKDKLDRVFPVEINSNYFRYKGIEYCCSIVHDISERKEAEAEKQNLLAQLSQAQRIESIGRLAGGIAHDFNNLLTPILGYSELLINILPDEKRTIGMIDNIIKAADKAKILTQQLLSFSRKQILEMKIVDLNSIVTSFHDILRRTIRENIEIKLSLSNDIIGVRGDRNQIEQIIMNLVVNAQDAVRDKGLITIETAPVFLDEEYARQHAEVQPGKYLMLVVTDTGSGMDKETLTHMYEPFFTTKGVGEGTGLGLATIYGIVKQHEGHIWVFSEVGKGTVFKLYFPVVEDQPIDRLDIIPDTDVLDSRERTVLLVEDNEMVRNLVYDFLVERGFNVIVEEGPKQAIKASTDQHIDLLVTDVVMPDMNGSELYKRLLGTHQGLKVLYMSGYAENIIAHHGILDEGINFIQKPFTAIDLSHKIHQALVDGG